MSDLAKKASGQSLHGPLPGKEIAPLKKTEAPLKKAILRTLSGFSTSPRANATATVEMKKSLGMEEE